MGLVGRYAVWAAATEKLNDGEKGCTGTSDGVKVPIGGRLLYITRSGAEGGTNVHIDASWVRAHTEAEFKTAYNKSASTLELQIKGDDPYKWVPWDSYESVGKAIGFPVTLGTVGEGGGDPGGMQLWHQGEKEDATRVAEAAAKSDFSLTPELVKKDLESLVSIDKTNKTVLRACYELSLRNAIVLR